MGDYTQLVLGFDLNPSTPETIILVLRAMMGAKDAPEPATLLGELPDHPLFYAHRWDYMLRCTGGGFGGETQVGGMVPVMDYDDDALGEGEAPTKIKYWAVQIRCSFKNYDGELDKFLDWIMPWCRTSGFIGYSRFEYNQEPTLIYGNERPIRIISEAAASAPEALEGADHHLRLTQGE